LSKYNSRPIDLDGHHFDSRGEARRYGELLILQACGQITGLSIHPTFELQPSFRYEGKIIRAISYEGDFLYLENGKQVVEDFKGVETEAFKIKRKLFLNKYSQIEFRIVK
jgi:hypothetical protein